MTEQWNQAAAYVQALRGQGYGDSDLATALRGGGWTEGEIQALLTGAPRPRRCAPGCTSAAPSGDCPAPPRCPPRRSRHRPVMLRPPLPRAGRGAR